MNMLITEGQGLGAIAMIIFASRELPLFFASSLSVPSSKEHIDGIRRGLSGGAGEVTSSSFATPLQLDIILRLRCLNRTWRDRLEFFTRGTRRCLLEFSISGDIESNSFNFESILTPPPSKLSEARRLARAFDYSNVGEEIISRSLMARGSYDPGFEGGTSVNFDYVTNDAPLNSSNPSSVARLEETALGKLLVARVSVLSNMREQYESDSLQPLDKHAHLCRCYKLLALSLHKQCTRFVYSDWKSSMNIETMGISEKVSDLYVEHHGSAGDIFWVHLSSRTSFSIEL